MTFGASPSAGGRGAASKKGAGPNGKNEELAARQLKGAAQASARKRRMLGV